MFDKPLEIQISSIHSSFFLFYKNTGTTRSIAGYLFGIPGLGDSIPALTEYPASTVGPGAGTPILAIPRCYKTMRLELFEKFTFKQTLEAGFKILFPIKKSDNLAHTHALVVTFCMYVCN